MSDAEKSPLDLTGLDFGPAWAKDKTPARDYSKEVGPREGRDRRGSGPRRSGGGGGGGGDRRNDRRQSNDRRNQRNDQRGDRRQPDRRGGDRRNQHREPRVEVPAPEGFVGGVMPVEEGLDNLSKEIQGGGRTYSVFDLARVVMGARERFNVTFEAPKGTKFFRCKSDGSVWLTKDEAVRHFWDAELLSELYEQIETEVDPPKGNFTSVAKCGLSGEWLAPPNYHSYQASIAQLHAERFSHMSLEDYKRRIRVENGEEVVAAWLESQTKQTRFRPLSTAEILELREKRKAAAAEEKKAEQAEAAKEETSAESASEPAAEEAPSESPAEETATDAPAEPVAEEAAESAEPTPEPEASSEEAPAEAAEEPAAEKAEPAAEIELLETRRDVERHFADHHFKHIFAEVDRAWVPGNVPAKLLSPALLTLLKATVADERRYPSKLTPILCRQLSGRHLAVFKWKKKLKAGPARPHAVPEDLTLAERPKKMLSWIEENSGKNLEDFWKVFLPEDADADTKRSYYHDLHWLLNQGFVLLMADSTIHLAKNKPKPEAPKKAKEEKKAPQAEETQEAPKAEAAPQSEEAPTAEQPVEAKAPEATPAPAKQTEEPKTSPPEEDTPSA
ncbi:hypothetical protein AAFN60_20020 [Roseibacillus persicicus]|uniref:hypothetical protein n=1 Tax=Roseibacillus persicicus TaxID=454148 RepID=UPI00398B2E8C